MKVFCVILVVCLWGMCEALPKETVLKSNKFADRSEKNLVEQFIKNHVSNNDALPPIDSFVTRSDINEIDVSSYFNEGRSQTEARKKSKIKKIFVPILVFIFIKAITLIPLALGLLSIKAWNAIQLSFVSFVTTIALAVWKLCSKVNGDQPQPQIYHQTYDPEHYFDHHQVAAARTDQQEEEIQMAYSGYSQDSNKVY
ncbi:uncharacterized protein LOC126746409 isoform X2 [Anthonomus grandis grandis]|uniref:uncharacterized protein LOC126746409 isoform X2 n=1 Tax=Anthonomus grandis grandis TaxID=2921223 RepID=UPI00216614D1|nr:uncharacterized protein LOC126746409 isoform X2 [Anthonomus grandis grandis]